MMETAPPRLNSNHSNIRVVDQDPARYSIGKAEQPVACLPDHIDP
jgi:hypothetical protein